MKGLYGAVEFRRPLADPLLGLVAFFPQGLLRHFEVRDVLEDGDGAGDLSFPVSQRARVEHDVPGFAVRAFDEKLRFIVGLAIQRGADHGHIGRLTRRAVEMVESHGPVRLDVLARRHRHPVQLLCRRIRVADGPSLVHDDDRRQRRIENHRQLRSLLLQLIEHLEFLGEVEHGADHADRLAFLVAEHISPGDHPGVGAVLATEAIAGDPAVGAAPEGRIHGRKHRVSVVGMNPLLPPVHGDVRLVRRVAEGGQIDFIVPESVGLHVPVPDPVVGGLSDELEAAQGLYPLLFGVILVGDVAGEDEKAVAVELLARDVAIHHAAIPAAVTDPELVPALPEGFLHVVRQCLVELRGQDVPDGQFQEFLAVHAEHPAVRLVGFQVVSFEVENAEPILEVADHAAVLLLRVHPVRNVADGDQDGVDAPGILELRHERRTEVADLPRSGPVEVRPSGSVRAEDLLDGFCPLGGHVLGDTDLVERVADEFLRRDVESRLDRPVHIQDPQFRVDTGDDVRGVLRERAEPPLGILEPLFGPHQGGDVRHRRQTLNDLACAVRHGVALQPHDQGGLVLAAQLDVALLGLAGLEDRQMMVADDILAPRPHVQDQRLALEHLSDGLKHGRGGQVRLQDHAVAAEDDISDGREIEEVGVRRPGLLQLGMGPLEFVILHLHLDLVDLQLVDRGSNFRLGHLRQGHIEGRHPLLGLPAEVLHLVLRLFLIIHDAACDPIHVSRFGSSPVVLLVLPSILPVRSLTCLYGAWYAVGDVLEGQEDAAGGLSPERGLAGVEQHRS